MRSARRSVRRLSRTLVFTAVVAGGSAFPVAEAHADSPNLFGWWTSTNQNTVSGEPIPTVVPGQNYGYQDPSNDIPSGGFEITNAGADTAFAAIGYNTNGATVQSVVLQVAPNANNLPNSTVEACPLSSDKPFQPEEAGPSSDGPAYDCTTSVPGVAGPNGQSVSFAVGNLVKNGYLGIAIVAGANSRTVFNAPGDSTVQVSEPDSGGLSLSDQSSVSDQSSAQAVPSTQSSGIDSTSGFASAPNGPASSAEPVASGPSLAAPIAAAAAARASSATTTPAPETAPAAQQAQLLAVTTPTATIGVGSATVGAALVGLVAMGTIRRNRRLARASEGEPDDQG